MRRLGLFLYVVWLHPLNFQHPQHSQCINRGLSTGVGGSHSDFNENNADHDDDDNDDENDDKHDNDDDDDDDDDDHDDKT